MFRIELPPGTHYASMWDIPDEYAGMTASMLQRSRALVLHGEVDVTILTFQHRKSFDPVRDRLRASGAMIDRMRLINVWEDVSAWTDDQLGAAMTTFNRPVPEGWEPLKAREADEGRHVRELRAESGRHIQIDHFRPDGTLLASDRRHGEGMRDRSVILCDTRGNPLGAWRRASSFFALWLDTLRRDPVAWIIVDSKTSANSLINYSRPDVVKIHVVRGSHLQRGGEAGTLVRSRRKVMKHLNSWDTVVFLTTTQRDEVAALLGSQDNLKVIPNSRNVPREAPSLSRPSGRGVMLSSLVDRKRVQHAIRAMAEARGRRLRWKGRLEVWGSGPLKRKLSLLIVKLRAPVRLRGYSPNAVDEFAHASFSLLTSSAEGLPGVLIESMGRGCIPISYDMPYGPADIITHGVNGFLVPNGDVKTLAAQIKFVVESSPADLAPLREAAYKRALEFSDERVMGLWASLMAEIAARRDTSNAVDR
ncbi:MAG TPA: glycosyltransferase [Aeromicrobium sp.]|nr:glycosyltransferase [Aeromicrobium sp.]HKY56468.1 glycosyltransferase [Aeromicrobium sp.]